jgi:NAD(P)-dependent dehydrogenase (short-subunit alcohol dehydrogenase family)
VPAGRLPGRTKGDTVGRLEGKVAIVSGAGRGVGRGVAVALAKEGAAVSIAELDPESGPEAAAELRMLGARSLSVECDVSQRSAVEAAVAATVAEFGTVDILVNNAQYLDRIDMPFEDLSEADMRRQFDSGVIGTFSFMQACFPHLRHGGGKVVNMASGAGVFGMEHFASYAAAKEAIRGMSRVAAREWGRYGINVNIICPSVPSPAVLDWMSRQTPDSPVAGQMPAIPRAGEAEADVGRVAVFLASADSDYMTGHTLMVDGGSTMDAGR